MKSVKVGSSAAGIYREWMSMKPEMRRLALTKQIQLRLSYLTIAQQARFLEHHCGTQPWQDLPEHRLEILLVQLKNEKGW